MNPARVVLERVRRARTSPAKRRQAAIHLLASIYDNAVVGTVTTHGVSMSVLARIATHRPGSTLDAVLAEARAELAETEAHPSEYPVASKLVVASAARKEGGDARALRHLADLLDGGAS